MPKSMLQQECYYDTHESFRRFPLDDLLRKHGFSILRRKKGLPTLWEKNRESFTQEKVLQQIPWKERQEAEVEEKYIPL